MNYIQTYQAGLNKILKAFTEQELKKKDVSVEYLNFKENEELNIKGMSLVKVNMGKVAFLISKENWKECENSFNKKVSKLEE